MKCEQNERYILGSLFVKKSLNSVECNLKHLYLPQRSICIIVLKPRLATRQNVCTANACPSIINYYYSIIPTNNTAHYIGKIGISLRSRGTF